MPSGADSVRPARCPSRCQAPADGGAWTRQDTQARPSATNGSPGWNRSTNRWIGGRRSIWPTSRCPTSAWLWIAASRRRDQRQRAARHLALVDRRGRRACRSRSDGGAIDSTIATGPRHVHVGQARTPRAARGAAPARSSPPARRRRPAAASRRARAFSWRISSTRCCTRISAGRADPRQAGACPSAQPTAAPTSRSHARRARWPTARPPAPARTAGTATITSCAMRSPTSIANGSARSVLSSATCSSPR